MSDQVFINGNQMSWASLKVKIAGQLIIGYTGLTYGDKRDQALLYGAGRAQTPRGKTSGVYTPDTCKITGYVSTIAEMRRMLAEQSDSGTSYGGVPFQVVAQFIENGSEDPQTIEINGCTWTSSSASFTQGTEGLQEDVEFLPMQIIRNGLALFEPQDL